MEDSEAAGSKEPQESQAESAGDDEVHIEEVPPDEEEVDSGDEAPKTEGQTPDDEMDRIEKEKKNMTAAQKLEHSIVWKAEGNDAFKKGEIFKAADSYYRAIIYCRELTNKPEYYPNLKHTEEQRQTAKDLCESAFTNLALVQTKHGSALPINSEERPKVLKEAVKVATEALKINAKNVKALFRRGVARQELTRGCDNAEAQQLCIDAKSDFTEVINTDPTNKDARAALKAVTESLKKLKKEEADGERKNFSFSGTLFGIGNKEKDLLGDGSLRKLQTQAGDGGKWLNPEWLRPGTTKCVVHVTCKTLPSGIPMSMSFILGETAMHEGVTLAVKSMTVGEVAEFTFAASKLAADSSLAKLLPPPSTPESRWEVKFDKFVTWKDLDGDGKRLEKIQNEGYGPVPQLLAELHAHWRVHGADGKLVHSSRYTINMGGEGAGGLKTVEDEDKPAKVCVLGETSWEPITMLCKSLRQGGKGELRLQKVPDLPKEEGDGAAAQISMMMNKMGKATGLEHCVVQVELEQVIQPLSGPEDARWEGNSSLVQERFCAEQLVTKGLESAALQRFRRVLAWADLMPQDRTVAEEVVAARAGIGWILVNQAAPILDLGNVSSQVLAVARKDLAEAEGHCDWLQENRPENAVAHLLKAKILVAQDDDFEGAHKHLLEAQRLAPSDTRIQAELRHVKVELRKEEEEQSKRKVEEIRDGLKRARTEATGSSQQQVMKLLKELSETKVSWDTVMSTRIGVELKNCQDCGEDAKKLCGEILGRFKDESKEQRPMWES
eukprot:gnl/TRDRNA2_/TRDRNA2_130811_c0_seq1.p1 gnl/TRDRNA2_/TRDRNA2_130811_c0~~gnl/TRDRNA2_/TRDRNA2_130811_c0_seq1.p1  ORF type:complete len:780 (-),score=210.43 gnl/TRDRNA2_/TRDRNA2_130811_c0_seq1:80-2419(-)